VHATQSLKCTNTYQGIKRKKRLFHCSWVWFIAAGKIDAFISAGNTGAMWWAPWFSIKAIEGLADQLSGIIYKRNGN